VPPLRDDRPAGASLILPAYNEADGLRATLASVAALRLDLQVIVVDDGSDDETAAVAEQAGAIVARHATNRGKGAALRTGIGLANSPRIITMDADTTYPAQAIPEVLALLDEHDYVSAARRHGRAHIPLVNRIGNALIASAIRRISGSRLADPLTGMYAMRRSALRGLHPSSDGFGIETEIAMKAAARQLHTAEIWIEYGPREGTSKLRPLRDGIEIMRTILGVALEARAPRRRTAY
jgi:glycosyltransferase involved in cell wall biosynthesis